VEYINEDVKPGYVQQSSISGSSFINIKTSPVQSQCCGPLHIFHFNSPLIIVKLFNILQLKSSSYIYPLV